MEQTNQAEKSTGAGALVFRLGVWAVITLVSILCWLLREGFEVVEKAGEILEGQGAC